MEELPEQLMSCVAMQHYKEKEKILEIGCKYFKSYASTFTLQCFVQIAKGRADEEPYIQLAASRVLIKCGIVLYILF